MTAGALGTTLPGPAPGAEDEPAASRPVKRVVVPQAEIPVVNEVDVLVVGGGPAGVGAAVAAARNGVKTLLVERYGFLGGMATAALVAEFIKPKSPAREMDGVFAEVLTRLKELGGTGKRGFIGIDWGRICYVLAFSPEVLKYLLDTMMEEAKVELLFHTLGIDVIQQGQSVKGLILHNKQGAQAVLAKTTIDATGDGDVAAASGAGFEIGRPEDHLQMAVSLCYKIGNVRLAPDAIVRAEDGSFRYAKPPKGYLTERDEERLIIPITALRVDATNARDLTRAEIEGRKKARKTVEWYRKEFPDFEDCHLIHTGVQVGVRSTRRILGDYVLTEEDVLEGKKFDDGVAEASFYCDVFEPDRPVVTHRYLKKEGDWYRIPYRCLLPRGIDGLLVAGRCISADYYAEASLRLMHTCMALGQAAGTAAALSIEQGISPRQLDSDRLCAALQTARDEHKAPEWCP
jgi:hypothetical protein